MRHAHAFPRIYLFLGGLLLFSAAAALSQPYVMPTPGPGDQICPDSPPTRLILAERARVTFDDPSPLRLRSRSGIDASILDELLIGSVVLVLDGPECADGYTWYQVQAGERVGWVAEGEPGLYYIAPYITG